jgi:hypothetical protein
MLFVDGENFTLRGQDLAEKHGVALQTGEWFEEKTLLWMPGTPAGQNLYKVGYPMQVGALRAYYYASVVGDDARRATVTAALWNLGFAPAVFRREKATGRSKGVDISLATDLLSDAFRASYDVAVLVAGDGDYAPLVDEVKRLGRLVCLAFFDGSGLNQELRLRADSFCELDSWFLTRWREHAKG